eukprot:6189043-Pleurochrysis_carterae.AAC.5
MAMSAMPQKSRQAHHVPDNESYSLLIVLFYPTAAAAFCPPQRRRLIAQTRLISPSIDNFGHENKMYAADMLKVVMLAQLQGLVLKMQS